MWATKKATIYASIATCVFNDGNGNWDNNGGKNYEIPAIGVYTVVNGGVRRGPPTPQP